MASFMGEKHFLKSHTIWGGLLNLLSWLFLFFYSKDVMSKHTAVIGMLSALGTLWSLLVVRGRFKADKKLYVVKKKNKEKRQ